MRINKEALLKVIESLDFEWFEIDHKRTLYDAAPAVNTIGTSRISFPKCEPREDNEISIGFTRYIKGVTTSMSGEAIAIPKDDESSD